jgi:hypothetical protein
MVHCGAVMRSAHIVVIRVADEHGTATPIDRAIDATAP